MNALHAQLDGTKGANLNSLADRRGFTGGDICVCALSEHRGRWISPLFLFPHADSSTLISNASTTGPVAECTLIHRARTALSDENQLIHSPKQDHWS